ncbi:MAG: type II toxin-antitoxin system VapC family toxin [Acidimicrobiaceae bacterium]|nr:type II toxin-antitoxin system VapC family toxin [Acidimicrobiaceae bacterium]
MSLVLDTNVLLRLVTDSADLGDGFKDAVETAAGDGEAAVSAITFVETTRLHHHGRIDLGVHPATWRRERLGSGLRELPVDGDIAVESVLLMNSGFHRDPADQIIVATAMIHGLSLATTDVAIRSWARRTRLVRLVDLSA